MNARAMTFKMIGPKIGFKLATQLSGAKGHDPQVNYSSNLGMVLIPQLKEKN